MQFILLFLTIFCISESQADDDSVLNFNPLSTSSLEDFYIRKGEQESKKSVYPRYRSGNNLGLKNDSVSAYFNYLLKEDPSLFEKKFPSTTVEEINRVLGILKSWVRYHRSTLDEVDLWGFDPFPKNDAVEEAKEMYRKHIFSFETKINQLREKRKKLYPPPKKSLMSRCALFFKKNFLQVL